MPKTIKELLDQYSNFGVPKLEDNLSPTQYYNTAHNVIVDSAEPYDENDYQEAEPATPVDGGFENSDESRRQQSIANTGSGIPVGPEGGVRAGQAGGSAPTTTAIDKETDEETPEKALTKYEQYSAILKKLQDTETANAKNLNYARGGGQIAQAIAYGYGAKIGDGSEQLDKVEAVSQKPVKDQLALMKLAKDQQSMKSPVGFGQFMTKDGTPVVYDPLSRQLINTKTNKVVTNDEGLIPRAVDRYAVDPRSNEGFVFSPGRTNAPTANNPLSSQAFGQGQPIPSQSVSASTPQSQVIPTSQAPVQKDSAMDIQTNTPMVAKVSQDATIAKPQKIVQSPFEIKQSLNNHDRGLLEHDVDTFQKAVEEPKRIISEIDAISDSTIELAKTNPNAANTLGAQIAKILQGSRLTDNDVKLYTGRTGIVNWLGDFVKELATGHIKNAKASDIKETLAVYNAALRKSLEVRAKNYANTVKTNFDPKLAIDTDSLSKLYYNDLPVANPKVEAAKAWLAKNPTSPEAEAVRAKIQKLESQ